MRKCVAVQMMLMAVLTACNEFPELEGAVSDDVRDAPYAELVPIETLQASASEPAIDDSTHDTIEGRTARLKARASALKSDVIDDDTQTRLQRATQ